MHTYIRKYAPIMALGVLAVGALFGGQLGTISQRSLTANIFDTTQFSDYNGEIGNFIFADTNKNGMWDSATEQGIAGVTVQLFHDANGNGTGELRELQSAQVTDAQGYYMFRNLPESDGSGSIEYVLRVPFPQESLEGLTATTGVYGLNNHAQGIGNHAVTLRVPEVDGTGNPLSTEFIDYCYYYADFGFAPIAPRVETTGSTGAGSENIPLPVQACSCDAVFPTGQCVSQYPVSDSTYTNCLKKKDEEICISEWVDRQDLQLCNSAADCACGDNTNPGQIGDIVWLDANGSGTRERNEDGLKGVKVTLLDAEGNVVDTIKTDERGQYLFTNLPLGEYTVVISPDQKVLEDVVSTYAYSPVLTNDQSHNPGGVAVTLTEASPTDYTIDFGYEPETVRGSVGNYIWADTDADGERDSGERGISGVTVDLLDDDGKVIATTVTDSLGRYSFTDLRLGEYTIVVTDENNRLGDRVSTHNQNTQTGNNVAHNPTGTSMMLTKESPIDETLDFGYVSADLLPEVLGAIGDAIWSENDNNGERDTDEDGIAGVTVTLIGDDGEVIATTTTDANGNYEFTDVPMGEYTVVVDQNQPALDGATSTHGTQDDPQNDEAHDPSGVSVTLTPDATQDMTIDFGFLAPEPEEEIEEQSLPTGQIGDKVWIDIDGDGARDSDEPGLPGVTLTLLDSEGNVLAVQTTDATGAYLFDNLPVNAEYTVRMATLNPALDTVWSTHSQADAATNDFAHDTDGVRVTLTANERVQRFVDFGLTQKRIENTLDLIEVAPRTGQVPDAVLSEYDAVSVAPGLSMNDPHYTAIAGLVHQGVVPAELVRDTTDAITTAGLTQLIDHASPQLLPYYEYQAVDALPASAVAKKGQAIAAVTRAFGTRPVLSTEVAALPGGAEITFGQAAELVWRATRAHDTGTPFVATQQITVPELGIDVPAHYTLMHDTAAWLSALQDGAAFVTTPAGGAVVIGHSSVYDFDTGSGPVFLPLVGDAQPGQAITFAGREYTVTDVLRDVDEYNVQDIKAAANNGELVLVTCELGDITKRVLVFAQ